MKSSLAHTLITEAIEIDLYEWMKYDQIRNNGRIRVYIPAPYNQIVYLPLANTLQKHGRRIWFLCPYCPAKRSRLYAAGAVIACRKCLGLKYASQYNSDLMHRRDMVERKISRLQKQKRRLWYADRPNKFGIQYYRLREQEKQISEAIRTEIKQPYFFGCS